jgi:hypothetical protein
MEYSFADFDKLVVEQVQGMFFETEEWVNGHMLIHNMKAKVIEIIVYETPAKN